MTERRLDKFSPLTMALLGGVCVGAGVSLFSGDWACSAVGLALLSVLLLPIADWLAERALRLRSRGPSRPLRVWNRRPQLVLLAAFTVALTGWSRLAYRLDRPRLFEAALGVPPPAGVTDLRVERHYGGGPGDMVCLIAVPRRPADVRETGCRPAADARVGGTARVPEGGVALGDVPLNGTSPRGTDRPGVGAAAADGAAGELSRGVARGERADRERPPALQPGHARLTSSTRLAEQESRVEAR